MDKESPNLLDWLSLGVDALIPLIIALIALLAKGYVDRLERNRASFMLAVSWRSEIFKELADNMNKIHRFYCYVGDWKTLDVKEVRIAKRRCDELVFSNHFLWSRDFLRKWQEFNDVAFMENQGIFVDFKFRCNVEMHKNNAHWSDSWEGQFVDEANRIKRSEFIPVSNDTMGMAAREIGVMPGRT